MINGVSDRTGRPISGPFTQALDLAVRIARETSPWVAVDDQPPDTGQLVLTYSEYTGCPFVVTWDAANLCFRDEEGSIVPGLYWSPIPEIRI